MNKNKKDLPVEDMIRLDEMCTGEKITNVNEFDYEKYLNFFGFKVEIEDLSCYFDSKINYMTMKDIYGNPIIKIDFILASVLKENMYSWNNFLIRKFAEVSVDHGKKFNKYPKGSIFEKGYVDIIKQKQMCKK